MLCIAHILQQVGSLSAGAAGAGKLARTSTASTAEAG
jgi:hypothetical protein